MLITLDGSRVGAGARSAGQLTVAVDDDIVLDGAARGIRTYDGHRYIGCLTAIDPLTLTA